MTNDLIFFVIWLYGHHLLMLFWLVLVIVGAATATTWIFARGK